MYSVQMRYLLGSNLLVADRSSSRECVGMSGTSYKMWLWLISSWRWAPEASHPTANCGVHSCANSTAFLYAIDAGFFIDTETGFICEVHAGNAILRACVCVYTYVIHMAIQVAVGLSHLHGLFPEHWRALAMRHYVVLKLQNIFTTVVSF